VISSYGDGKVVHGDTSIFTGAVNQSYIRASTSEATYIHEKSYLPYHRESAFLMGDSL